jgi:hypothetical protein
MIIIVIMIILINMISHKLRLFKFKIKLIN